MDACRSTKHLIDSVKCVTVHMELHRVHFNVHLRSSKAKAVILIDKMAVHVKQQSPVGIVCMLSEWSAPNLDCLTIYSDYLQDAKTALGVSLLS